MTQDNYAFMDLADYGGRNPEHFIYPQPSWWQRARSNTIQALGLGAEYVNGIDISKWQGVDIDFKQVKAAGYQFVIIKATDGLAVDPLFESYWPQVVDADLIPGVYHFFRGNVDGKTQGVHHLNTISELLEATSLMIPSHADVESYDGVNTNTRLVRLFDFLGYMAAHWRVPGVYSSIYYWQRLTNNTRLVDPYTGWVAHWTGIDTPSIPGGWQREQVKLWQWGIAGKFSWCPAAVPGVPGAVDLDRFLGTYDELKAWAGYQQQPECPCQDQIDQLDLRIKKLEEKVNSVIYR